MGRRAATIGRRGLTRPPVKTSSSSPIGSRRALRRDRTARLYDTPSPPPGAERVGGRWGSHEPPRPTSPSPSLPRRGPSLSPLKGGEGRSFPAGPHEEG